jgi:carbonic anhydrase
MMRVVKAGIGASLALAFMSRGAAIVQETAPSAESVLRVRINVEGVVDQLRTSRPVLADQVARGKLRAVGAVCSLDTGKVTWLPEPAAK